MRIDIKNIRSVLVIGLAGVLMACGGGSSSSSSSSAMVVPASNCQPFAGNSSVQFRVSGTVASMNGVIDCTVVTKVQQLLRQHPGLTTIRMLEVPGSMDDTANLRAGFLVRQAGLDTVLASRQEGGLIASGGVDFFLAGRNRSIEAGGIVAVHSWADDDGVQGIELYGRNPDHPDHQEYIDYYRSLGFSDTLAREFYVYTLRAAPANMTHCMLASELRRYDVVTGDQDSGVATLAPTITDGGNLCNSFIGIVVPD